MLETEVIAYRPRWFQNPLLPMVIAAAAGLFWLGTVKLGMSWPFCLVLVAQVILFILLFKRPVWAMASLIVAQLTVNSFQFSIFGVPMSLRLFWTIMVLIFLVPILRERGKLEIGSRVWLIIIPAITFFFLATISNLINTDLYYTIRYLRNAATALTILFLLPASIENEMDLKILSLVALITCSASAIFALMQHYTSLDLAPVSINEIILYDARVTGLSPEPYAVGYIFPVVLLPMIGLYFLKGVKSRTRVLLLFLAAIIATALYFSFTRSGIYSLALGLLVMIFYMKGKPKKQLLVVFLVIFIAFFAFVFAAGNRYVQGFGDESSAAGRLVLWQAGLNIALDNPILGIGANRFTEVSPEYASTISSSSMQTQGAGRALGVYAAHDDFLTIWLSFGIVALLVYLWLFVNIFHKFLEAYRHSKTRFLKGFTLGCIGAMPALLLYSAVQNLMESSMLLWVMAGLAIATTKLAFPSDSLGKRRFHEGP
jgi:oligosaccharide repeat unit polymerase